MKKTQRIPQSRMIAIAGFVIVVGLISLAAYLHFAKGFVWAAGTGLDQKTFWDWLELLIVPAMLALGGLLLNSIQHDRDQKRAETDRAIAEDRQRETALQNYLDKMTDLLLEHNLATPEAKNGSPKCSTITDPNNSTNARPNPQGLTCKLSV